MRSYPPSQCIVALSLVGILAEVLIHDKSVNASTVYRTPVLSTIYVILALMRIGVTCARKALVQRLRPTSTEYNHLPADERKILFRGRLTRVHPSQNALICVPCKPSQTRV